MRLNRFSLRVTPIAAFAASVGSVAFPARAQIGTLEGQVDAGTVLHPGSATYDPQSRAYAVSGSGNNMWFGEDDFHFAWKKLLQ